MPAPIRTARAREGRVRSCTFTRSDISHGVSERRSLEWDRLAEGAVVEVRLFEGLSVEQAREPHRHDYHELIWVRSGEGEHLIDGDPVPVRPGAVTVIGRGRVHQFSSRARRGRGTAALPGRGARPRRRAGRRPRWMLAGGCARTILVPADEDERLAALVHALAAEAARPPDAYTADAQRHLVTTLLLWLERWYDAARADQPDGDDAEVQLARRFIDLLERDFAAHHGAAHYADALRVPPAALAHALREVSGRSTKELVTERVMLEAARLLRFTDLTVGQIAFRVGFEDPLYFSRAFKRHSGLAPQSYREAQRGKSMHPPASAIGKEG